MTSGQITFDQSRGATRLSTRTATKVLRASAWDGKNAYRSLVARELTYSATLRSAPPDAHTDAWIPLELSLVARPDNDYNPAAISFCLPSDGPGTVLDRHLGYLAEWQLHRYGDALQKLIAATPGEVLLSAWVPLDRIEYPEDVDLDEPDEEGIFTIREQLKWGHWVGDLSLRLPEPAELTDLVGQYIAGLAKSAKPTVQHETSLHAAFLLRLANALRHAEHVRGSTGVWGRETERSRATAERQANALEDLRQWASFRAHWTTPTSLRAVSRTAWGVPRVLVVNGAGAEVGQYHLPAGPLTLVDERLRPDALAAVSVHGINATILDLSTLSDFPDARLVTGRGGDDWAVLKVDDTRTQRAQQLIGEYDPATAEVTVYAPAHQDPVSTLVQRHGLPVSSVHWSSPDENVREFNQWAEQNHRAAQGNRRPSLQLRVEHRDVAPERILQHFKIKWIPRGTTGQVTARDHRAMLENPYYRQALSAFLGERVPAEPAPALCRLCASPALDAGGLAYCFSCSCRAQRGSVPDPGGNGPWVEVVLWALRQLAEVEFSGPPSRAQLTALTITNDELADQMVLCRIMLPHADPGGTLLRSSGGPRTWTQWLATAGLLADGQRLARGTASIATDGHLCRSLLERHVDDFLHHHGIAHTTEPSYPRDAELNTTGLRADWLLDDGTFVEAWGFTGDAEYMATARRKQELAEKVGIRLVTLTVADLPRLASTFKDWLRAPAS